MYVRCKTCNNPYIKQLRTFSATRCPHCGESTKRCDLIFLKDLTEDEHWDLALETLSVLRSISKR
jgi:tRNA G26 N,N-dimethylase Trm1